MAPLLFTLLALAVSALAAPGPAAVGRVRLAGAARTVRADAPFRAAGFVYRGERALFARASADGLDWTPWLAVEADDAGPGRWSGLAWFDAPRRYLQVSGAAEGVEALFIDPGPSPPAAVPQPAVVAREQWGCTPQACPAREPPAYTTVTHLVVHHTAGANAASDWPAVVRSIWVLHVNGNGWNDIGYNFLIDPTGVVYEGRAGGQGVVGAHFSGVNGGTMGVAVLGTYSSLAPPEAIFAPLAALLAWQSAAWNLDPSGRSLHASSGLSLAPISGHRDAGLSPRATSTTECPGNGLYTLLPRLRHEVRALLDGDCPLTLSRTAACLSSAAAGVEIGAALPSGCALALESGAPWLAADRSAAGFTIRVQANPGDLRTGWVSAGGRKVEITQAAVGAPPPPCVAPGGVISAAAPDGRPAVAGSLVSVFGSGLAEGIAAAGGFPLPTELGGTSLLVNGRPAFLLYVSPGQINFQLPPETRIGSARLQFSRGALTGPETMISVTEAVPAIFADASGRAVAINHEDGRLNGPDAPARPGGIVILYLAGVGGVRGGIPPGGAPSPAEPRPASLPFTFRAGGLPAAVLYLGLAPGTAGVYQCNLLIPRDLPAGPQSLVATVAGAASLPATLFVGAP